MEGQKKEKLRETKVCYCVCNKLFVRLQTPRLCIEKYQRRKQELKREVLM